MAAEEDLPITGGIVIPGPELRWRFSRSSGPGGQSVNTTDSKAELLFDVARSATLAPHLRTRALARLSSRLVDGVVSVTASDSRSQLRNREAARHRLALLLREALAPPATARRPTRPSLGSKERRIADKKRRGEVKRLRNPDAD